MQHIHNLLFKLNEICETHKYQKHHSTLILKMLAIYVLSEKQILPNKGVLNETIAENKSQWLALIDLLAKSDEHLITMAFTDSNRIKQIPMPLIYDLIMAILDYQPDIKNSEFASTVIEYMLVNEKNLDNNFLPISVAQLVHKILQVKTGDSVYAISPSTLPYAVLASHDNDQLVFECTEQSSSSIISVISLLCQHTFNVVQSDYLRHPSCLNEGLINTVTESKTNQGLKKFDHAVSFSNMAQKFDQDIAQLDKFDRFNVRIRTTEVANILHLLKQAEKTVVATVSDSVLFSSPEEELRRFLVNGGYIKAVISLPNGVWTSTYISSSLLVLDPKGGHENVRFVDVSKTDCVLKNTQRQVSLQHLDKLVQYLQEIDDTDYANTVTREEIIEKKYNLMTQRYVIDLEQKNYQEKLANNETVKLGTLVDFVRGLPHKTEAGEYTVMEVGASDLNEIGDISTPTKEVMVSKNELNKHHDSFLQADDIILMLKGSAGKVGIVSEEAPTSDNNCWMVNRSGIVLRMKNSQHYQAKVLYSYLCSDIGKALLTALISGASIPNISLKQLKEMNVMLPSSEDEISNAIESVERGREIQKEIKALISEQRERQSSLWQL